MAERDDFGLVGQILDGQYRVDAFVGEGDLSLVYKAHHFGLDAPVAIKFLNLPSTLEPSLVKSFIQGFRDGSHVHYRLSQGSLYIARSISSGTARIPATGADVPYLVREWLEGRSLAVDFASRRAEGCSGRSLPEVLSLLEPAALALAHAHAQKIVHTRINPSNLFLAETPNGVIVKVLDFGIARALTRPDDPNARPSSELQIFYPAYAAPEQFERTIGDVGPWTDVYTLALIVLEALRDKPAMTFRATVDCAAFVLDKNNRPTPKSLGLELGPAVDAVLTQAVALEPSLRPQDAAEFWDALKRAAVEDGVVPEPASSPSKRNEPSGSTAAAAPPTSKRSPLAFQTARATSKTAGLSGATVRIQGNPAQAAATSTAGALKRSPGPAIGLASRSDDKVTRREPVPEALLHRARAGQNAQPKGPAKDALPTVRTPPVQAQSLPRPQTLLGLAPPAVAPPSSATGRAAPPVSGPAGRIRTPPLPTRDPSVARAEPPPPSPPPAPTAPEPAPEKEEPVEEELIAEVVAEPVDALAPAAPLAPASPSVDARSVPQPSTVPLTPPPMRRSMVSSPFWTKSVPPPAGASTPPPPAPGFAPPPMLPQGQVSQPVMTPGGMPLPPRVEGNRSRWMVVLAIAAVGLFFLFASAVGVGLYLYLSPKQASPAPASAGSLIPASASAARLASSPSLQTSAPPPPLPPVAPTPTAPFNRKEARAAIDALAPEIAVCKRPGGKVGKGLARVVFAPDGTALSTSVVGSFAKTPEGDCVAVQLRHARVSPFKGPATAFMYEFTIPR